MTTGKSAKVGIHKAVCLVAALFAVAAVIFLYRNTFWWWWAEWTGEGSYYAHALFVPIFVTAMIWRDRQKLAAAPWDPSWLGIAFLVPFAILFLLGVKSEIDTIKSLSFMLLIFGVSTLIVGKTRTRMLTFPILFVLMMMPIVPDQLINTIAFPIQITSAKIATALLNAMTLHSVRQGTIIAMDVYTLNVELPCSGFKTLISLLTFTAAFAYLTDAERWKRWTLFVTTIPLSLVINALRITLIGMVGELISAPAAKTFHDYSGFIVLILAFTFLFNLARFLKCKSFLGIDLLDPVDDKRHRSEEVDVNEPAVPGLSAENVEADQSREPWWKPIADIRIGDSAFVHVSKYLCGLAGFLVLAALTRAIAIKPVVPLPPIGRAQVPQQFTVDTDSQTPNGSHQVTFRAEPDPDTDKLPKYVQDQLNPTRVINRVYRGSDGAILQLMITAGNGRRVFHDPHTCMLGGDAVLNDIQMLNLPTKAGNVKVLETRFHKTSQPVETEMLLCYALQGQLVPHTEDVRNLVILQTLFGDGGQPSYCFRVTQMSSGSDEEKRRQIITFVRGIWGEIGNILEGKAKGDPTDGPPVPITTEETAQR